jgi:hypothetical protein
MTSDAWDNRKKSEKITAADVRPGDIVAGNYSLHKSWIEPDAYRTVREVSQDPAGIRIQYTTARGVEHDRTFPADTPFYRIAERPELPAIPGPQPERMDDYTYKRLEEDRNMLARFAAESILPGGSGVKRARQWAREYAEKEKEYEAENAARSKQNLLDLIADERTGERDATEKEKEDRRQARREAMAKEAREF